MIILELWHIFRREAVSMHVHCGHLKNKIRTLRTVRKLAHALRTKTSRRSDAQISEIVFLLCSDSVWSCADA